jgi:CDP-2,3-bis-(O-geranylgeranyl)-sn-glycerol synthase
MELILSVIVFSLKTIYTSLPGVIANVVPFALRKVPILDYQLDFGLTMQGRPLLGSNKTFRGLAGGILASMTVMYIQFALWKYLDFSFHLVDFETVNFHLLAFLMGFGVIFGDSFESFIKRRLNISPGASLIPWDQIDCILGGLLFGRIAWNFSWQYAVAAIVLTFLFHIIIRHMLYYFKVTEKKW